MQMHKKNTTPLGIIEGFFGRAWQWEDRTNYAEFLALHNYDFYIYAPKSDKHLRTQWQTDWPTETKQQLRQLRSTYSTAGVEFGIGLSPHELYLDTSRNQRQQLKKRIQQINDLQPDILCILFDDMRGDIPKLAEIQIDIAHEAADLSDAGRIIFCPTYYSFDSVLEKVFGKMPDNYWQTFAQQLDKNIDIFWTGEKVCSPRYDSEHLIHIGDLLGRKPFLWDNYPVNDGAVKSNLLQLRAFDKSHGQLEGRLAGHAVNPMNQPWLSKIPLASLPLAYRQAQHYSPEMNFNTICQQLCGADLARQLTIDLSALQDHGLKHLDDNEKAALRSRYAHFHNNPFAREIIEWLDGAYTFDPACLTE